MSLSVSRAGLTHKLATALIELAAQPDLTLDQQLNQVVKIGAETLGLQLGIISRIEGLVYSVLYAYTADDSQLAGQTFDFKQTYCEIAYQADGLIAIDRMGESQYKGHPCYTAFGLETYIGMPLVIKGKRFGTLNFSSPIAREQVFTSEDRDLLLLLAQWVSTMLDRKFAEDQLRSSEASLRSIIASSPAIITRTNRDCLIEFTHVPGVDPELLKPLIGQSFIDFMPAEFHDLARSQVAYVFAHQTNAQYESSALNPLDGLQHWYNTNIAPVIEDGQVVSALLVNIDITERRSMEESLRLNARAVESSPVGIVIADAQQPDMPLIYVNPTFEAITGYSAAETVGKNCRFLQADDHDQPALNVLRSALKQDKACVVILRNYRKDGTLFWNELSLSPIHDARGVTTHFLGIQTDITERIETERTLKQRDAILQAVASSSALLLQHTNWQESIETVLASLGKGTGANRTFIFETQPDAPEDQVIVSLRYEWVTGDFPPDIDNPLLQNLPLSDVAPRWANLAQNKQTIRGFTRDFAEDERALLNPDVVHLLIMPIFSQGRLWGALGFDDCEGTHQWTVLETDLLQTVADNLGMTIERRQIEQQVQRQNESLVKANRELAVARKQAEAANLLKSQFLATMSHELRTPLNAVIGYAQLQLAGMVGALSDEQYGFQERILANAQHLLGLINEVLDLSKIEAGRLDLAEKPFDLRACMAEIVFQNQVLAADKGLTFSLMTDERLPEMIVGDRGRIKQVIINLISNAIKFTDTGAITVDIVLYNKDNWRVTVTDTGTGIAPHLQETIFDEFRQAENGLERGGTGLGLAIVRKLVLMMGGNIRLNSEVGVGSTFTVTLPLITEMKDDGAEDSFETTTEATTELEA